MSFTIVLPSSKGVTQGSNNGYLQYMVNWSNFEEGKYEMSFTFQTDHKATGNYTDTYLVMLEGIGALNDVYFPTNQGQSGGSIYTTGIIGFIHPETPTGCQYLCARKNDNLPITFKQRPTSNTFSVKIVANDTTTLLALGEAYNLILHFKKI